MTNLVDEKRLEELEAMGCLCSETRECGYHAAIDEFVETLSLALKVVRAAQKFRFGLSEEAIKSANELDSLLAPFSQGEKEPKE